MKFDWAPWKAESNKRKHGLTFVFGTRVFEDPLHVDVDAAGMTTASNVAKRSVQSMESSTAWSTPFAVR